MWPKWLRAVIGAWVAYDSKHRGNVSFFWIFVILLLGPLLVPCYLAARPLLPGEKSSGSFFWNAAWNFEKLLSGLIALAAMAVSVENLVESQSTDLALVKRAEIKAGTIFGCFVTFVLYGISRIVMSSLREALEKSETIEN